MHSYFDIHLVDDEVSFTVYLLVNSLDSHVARSAGEISCEMSCAAHRNKQNSSVNIVASDDIQMRKFNLERVLRCIFNDTGKVSYIKMIGNEKSLLSFYLKFFRIQLEAPYALMSSAVTRTPWPVLLPATIRSPNSIGSRLGISYCGIPVTR